jgi:hypothetical protein
VSGLQKIDCAKPNLTLVVQPAPQPIQPIVNVSCGSIRKLEFEVENVTYSEFFHYFNADPMTLRVIDLSDRTNIADSVLIQDLLNDEGLAIGIAISTNPATSYKVIISG